MWYRKIKEHRVFLLIFGSAAILRLFPLFNYQFTFDELSGLDRTQFNSFKELIEKGVKIDAHPALIQIIIFYLSHWFGYSNWIIKLPFLLFSLAAIVYAYLFAFRFFSKQVAIISTIIFSYSLIFVFYAPIARMYISGIFFSIALLYYFYKIIFLDNTKLKSFIGFGIFAWLSAINHHISALFAFTVVIFGVFLITKNNRKNYFITCLLITIAYLPHLSITLFQLGVAGIGIDQGGWLEKPNWLYNLLILLKVIFGTGYSYLLIIGFIIVNLLFRQSANFTKKHVVLFMLFIINYTIVIIYSIYRAPIFQNSVMLFASVGLIIFISSFLQFKNKHLFYCIAGLLSATLLFYSYIKKDYFNQAVKTIFEYQFERTNYYQKLYGNNSLTSVFFDADSIMIKIYSQKYKTKFNCHISSDSSIKSMQTFIQLLKNSKTNYLVLSSAMPIHQAFAQQYFPHLIENKITQAINYQVYSKQKQNISPFATKEKIIQSSTIKNKNNFTYIISKAINQPINNGIVLDSNQEFPFEASADYNQIATHEGQVVLIKTKYKTNKHFASSTAACISVNTIANNQIISYNSNNASESILNKDSSINMFTMCFIGSKHSLINKEGAAKIKCYLWNKGKENLILKEFKIEVIDFWPNKWQFWD